MTRHHRIAECAGCQETTHVVEFLVTPQTPALDICASCMRDWAKALEQENAEPAWLRELRKDAS